MSQSGTETSVSLGTFIRGDRMSYGSRCCYSVSIEVQQPPTQSPIPIVFWRQKFLEISIFINPILPGIWKDVVTWGGGIMAPPDFLLESGTNTQNLFQDKFFDI